MSSFPGIVCKGCERNDALYEDSHGTFCRRCGPSVPVKDLQILWYTGMSVDQKGEVIHYEQDGKGGLSPLMFKTSISGGRDGHYEEADHGDGGESIAR